MSTRNYFLTKLYVKSHTVLSKELTLALKYHSMLKDKQERDITTRAIEAYLVKHRFKHSPFDHQCDPKLITPKFRHSHQVFISNDTYRDARQFLNKVNRGLLGNRYTIGWLVQRALVKMFLPDKRSRCRLWPSYAGYNMCKINEALISKVNTCGRLRIDWSNLTPVNLSQTMQIYKKSIRLERQMPTTTNIRTVKLVLPPRLFGLLGNEAETSKMSKRRVIESAINDFLEQNDLNEIPDGSLSAQPLAGVTYRAPMKNDFYKDLYSKALFAGFHLDSVVYNALLQKFGCYKRI